MKEIKFTPKGYDYFLRIQNSANRMQLLINDLLKYTNISKGEKTFEKADLNELLNGALEEISHLIEEKKAKIEAGNLPHASVIPFQFHQLFMNIIGNALKYAYADQVPVVKIQTKKLTPEEMELFPQYFMSDLIKIVIRDNGSRKDPGTKSPFIKGVWGIFSEMG
ncbi:MAG: hypothetical protein WD431_11285 [Cyclobacteriaceae bacterium]